MSLDPATTLGAVRLTVRDLDAVQSYYERVIGLKTLDRTGDVVQLGAAPGATLVELHGVPDAPQRPPHTTGLFHLALLVPDRPALAQTIQRVVSTGVRFTGASDHLVSEAMYLRDPEGNGIELYRDRPRSEWQWQGENVAMDTLALDVDAVMAELPQAPDEGMPAGTIVGHVHLNIRDIAEAEAFYSGIIGFEVMVRGYPGALFVAAGGSHHHIGLNTWNGEHAPAPPAGAAGLRSFDVVLPDAAALDDVLSRVSGAGIAAVEAGGGTLVADPSGNHLLLRLA